MTSRPRIAVVGAGIAGLGAAHRLGPHADVTLFEADERLGGHAHTVAHDDPHLGPIGLDTGFLVYNRATYPRFGALLNELGVESRGSEMSFAVSCERCGLEYSGRRLWRQPRVATDRSVRSLLREIVRFMATGRRARRHPHMAHLTLDGFVTEFGYSRAFRDHFLVPLTAAIWSSAPGLARGFPMTHALAFYDNHSLLGFRRHTWLTVEGGSRRYVDAVAGRLGDRARTGCPVRGVTRDGGVALHTGTDTHRADGVVLATHPDQALGLLADATAAERDVLGALPYTSNTAILHTDTALLPRRAACRAAWNYQLADCGDPATPPTMTYYLNRLQRIASPVDYMVTLNRADVDPARVIRTIRYAHPQYTHASRAARARLPEIQGTHRTWYAGAYHGNGFHEDGLRAGQRAADQALAAL